MGIRINGTETTRRLIGNTVNELRKGRPNSRHVDYVVSLSKNRRNSELLTSENDGIMRNVSILYINDSSFFNRIEAAIGNKTGNVLIGEKPFFMSAKRAFKKVQEFLAQLQPENLAKAEKIKSEQKVYKSFITLKTSADFGRFRLTQTTKGSDAIKPFEQYIPFRTL